LDNDIDEYSPREITSSTINNILQGLPTRSQIEKKLTGRTNISDLQTDERSMAKKNFSLRGMNKCQPPPGFGNLTRLGDQSEANPSHPLYRT
jgi:hypothetical protein